MRSRSFSRMFPRSSVVRPRSFTLLRSSVRRSGPQNRAGEDKRLDQYRRTEDRNLQQNRGPTHAWELCSVKGYSQWNSYLELMFSRVFAPPAAYLAGNNCQYFRGYRSLFDGFPALEGLRPLPRVDGSRLICRAQSWPFLERWTASVPLSLCGAGLRLGPCNSHGHGPRWPAGCEAGAGVGPDGREPSCTGGIIRKRAVMAAKL